MHINFKSKGLTNFLTKAFNKNQKGINLKKTLPSAADLDTFENFFSAKSKMRENYYKNDEQPSYSREDLEWIKKLTPELIERIKKDFPEETPLSLLASENGVSRLTESIIRNIEEESISEEMTNLYFYEQLENLANSDRYKIPEVEILKTAATKFNNYQKEELLKLGVNPIIENKNFLYDEKISELGNSFLRVIDTFGLPKNIKTRVSNVIKSLGYNTELQGLVIADAIKHSDFLSDVEKNNGDIFPTVSVIALSDTLNSIVDYGKMLNLTDKNSVSLEGIEIPKEFTTNLTKEDLMKSYSLISNIVKDKEGTTPLMELKKIYTDYKKEKGKSPTSLLESIYEKYTPNKLSNFLSSPRNLKNTIFDRIEDSAERQLAYSQLLDKVVGIKPNDSLLTQITRIATYLTSNYDARLLKYNSIYRDAEIDSLNAIYDFFENNVGGTTKEINERMENLLINVYDSEMDGNLPHEIKKHLINIKEVNLSLSHELQKEFERITGVKPENQSEFYYRQQWSQGRVKERVAYVLNKKVNDKISYEEGSEGYKALEKLGETFYSLLDINKMKYLKEEDINLKGDLFSKDRKELADKLKHSSIPESSIIKSEYKTNVFNELTKNEIDDYEYVLYKYFGNNLRTNKVIKTFIEEIKDNFDLTNDKSINKIDRLLNYLVNTVNEDFTFEKFMDSFKEIAVGDPLVRSNRKIYRGITLGDRQFHFKDGASHKLALQLFSDQDSLLEALQYTTDSQIKKLTLMRVGFPEGVDFRELFEAFKSIHGLVNERNKESVGFFDLNQSRLVASTLNTMFNSHPYIETFPKNKWLAKLEALASLSSLGGIYNTILSSDSVGKAILTNRGIVGSIKGFIDYFAKIYSEVPDEVMRATVASRDHMFMNESRVRENDLDKAYKFMDRIWGISEVDMRGKYATTYSVLRTLTDELTAGEEGFISKALREKGMSDEHFNYLKENLEKLVYDDSTGRVLSLRGFYDHPLLEDVESYIYRAVQSVIPSRGLLSKSLQATAKASGIPIMSAVLTNMLRFAGITTEQMYNVSLEPLILNNKSDFLKSRYTIAALMESTLYHLMRSIGQGKINTLTDDDGKISFEKTSILIKEIIMDSPLFGIFGGLITAALEGDLQSMLGSRALGGLYPGAKALKSIGDLTSGNYGSAANNLISSANLLNPIRNVPVLGFLLDRVLLDSLRSAVYPDAEKYFTSLKNFTEKTGQSYFIEPGSFWDTNEEKDDKLARKQKNKLAKRKKEYKLEQMKRLGIKQKDKELIKSLSDEEYQAKIEEGKKDVDEKLNEIRG